MILRKRKILKQGLSDWTPFRAYTVNIRRRSINLPERGRLYRLYAGTTTKPEKNNTEEKTCSNAGFLAVNSLPGVPFYSRPFV